MQYPINYDFGKNRREQVVPHLNNEDLLEAIQAGVDMYSGYYRESTSPASYVETDWYSNIERNRTNDLIDHLRETKELPDEYIKLEQLLDDDEENNVSVDQRFDMENKLIEMRNALYRQFYAWEETKYSLEEYVLFHACHEWNPTFGLTLAGLVDPKENWVVRCGPKHTTIINETGNKCFDILYWASFGRMNNYLYDWPLTKECRDDMTLGGRDAYIDSMIAQT